MESKGSNLYIADRSFFQDWTLRFKEKSTEQKFLSESLRLHWQSLQYSYIWSIIMLLFAYITEEINVSTLTTCIFSLICVLIPSDVFLKRLILQVICITWENNLLKNGNLSDCFGLFLPSFILNFFMLKSWIKSALFFTFEICVISIQTSAPLSNLLIVCGTYTFFISTFEKDFRDIWHLYSSYKKSNCLNKSLWDTLPAAQVLVNTEGKIIYYNKAAVDMIKFQNKSEKILKGGNFEDFYDDFSEQAKNMLTKSLKGQPNEEVYASKHNGSVDDYKNSIGQILIADLVSWVSGNCTRVVSFDVSCHIAKKYLVLVSMIDVESLVQYFSKIITQMYTEKKPLTNQALCLFNRVHQNFKGAIAIQSNFVGNIGLKIENFDVNAEVFNMIELLYLASCSHNVGVIYTREKGIPNAVVGERSMHNVLIFSILDFAIKNSIPGTDISLLVQISVIFIQTAVHSDVSLSYKFSFNSEKTNNIEVENLFCVRKNSPQQRDMDQVLEGMKKFGTAFASVDTILIALKGYLIPVSSEVDRNKVIINIVIPFKTCEKNFKSNLIEISKKVTQVTPLTTKWVPEKNIENISFNEEIKIFNEQINLVNAKNNKPKRSIQNCDSIEIKPFLYKSGEANQISESSSSDYDLIEENDASFRMKNYNLFGSEYIREKSYLDKEYFESSNSEKNSLRNLSSL